MAEPVFFKYRVLQNILILFSKISHLKFRSLMVCKFSIRNLPTLPDYRPVPSGQVVSCRRLDQTVVYEPPYSDYLTSCLPGSGSTAGS